MPSLFTRHWHWHRKSDAVSSARSLPLAVEGVEIEGMSLQQSESSEPQLPDVTKNPKLERSSARVCDNNGSGSVDSEAESVVSSESSTGRESNCLTSAIDNPLEPGQVALVGPPADKEREIEPALDDDFDLADESEFDDDAVFALTPNTCPGPSRRSVAAVEHLPLRVFVGSWNMAACDPFADRKGHYIGDTAASSELSEFLPTGYDLYVLGTQEKVSKHLHTAVLARLNVGGVYERLDLSDPENRRRKCKSVGHNTHQESSMRASSFGLASPGTNSSVSNASTAESPADMRWSFVGALDWRSSIFQPPMSQQQSETALTKRRRRRRHELPGQGGEVRGRGDGAFLSRKSTSLSIYVAKHWSSRVHVVAAGAHKFSVASGSKGGLAATLRFDGDDQTVTFANCHLDANDAILRRQQLATLAHELPAAMGVDAADLASASSHVVWVGDFNYRIRGLGTDAVAELLRTGRHMELHDEFDCLADDLAMVPALASFREPVKWPTFLPTYKKLPGRSAQHSEDDADWPRRVYRLRYREPLYKGGRVKDRVPAWCDRVLVSSSDDRGRLRVEQRLWRARDGHFEDSAMATQQRDNYRAANDALRGSDHSPVSCTFVWRVRHPGLL